MLDKNFFAVSACFFRYITGSNPTRRDCRMSWRCNSYIVKLYKWLKEGSKTLLHLFKCHKFEKRSWRLKTRIETKTSKLHSGPDYRHLLIKRITAVILIWKRSRQKFKSFLNAFSRSLLLKNGEVDSLSWRILHFRNDFLSTTRTQL